jgi:DAACS family dicarboxylate/amino acid:cation (Na+ or H+) symporter
MSDNKASNLTNRILIALVSGAVIGMALNFFAGDSVWVKDWLAGGLFEVVGSIFVSALKMLVVPLVFVSLVNGVTNLGDAGALGRLGIKSLSLYVLTTAVAITVALTLAIIVDPGAGLNLAHDALKFNVAAAPDLAQVIIDIVPSNPIAALADGKMLQIIVFSLLFGVAITMAGDHGRHVLALFSDLDAVIMKMVDLVMALAPIGVFALIARTFSQQGLDVLLPLINYFMVVTGALFVHLMVSYGVLLRVVGGLSPLMFLRKMRPPMLFAFSTASSAATIPITLKTVETRLGVKNAVASFTVPLGATINMDGTAIMQGVATVFIASVYGVDLGMSDYLAVILTATLASIGTAGVPGVGLIMLAMVLHQVNLPVEGIALIIGVDRLLDMMRTAVNIAGDGTVTCLVAKSEGALDKKRFDDPEAGEVDPDRIS